MLAATQPIEPHRPPRTPQEICLHELWHMPYHHRRQKVVIRRPLIVSYLITLRRERMASGSLTRLLRSSFTPFR